MKPGESFKTNTRAKTVLAAGKPMSTTNVGLGAVLLPECGTRLQEDYWSTEVFVGSHAPLSISPRKLQTCAHREEEHIYERGGHWPLTGN